MELSISENTFNSIHNIHIVLVGSNKEHSVFVVKASTEVEAIKRAKHLIKSFRNYE
tara:strand:- start:194 stop:361 length:168 start_codon:yes stop_codon:yes gene_type:complete